MSELLDGIKEGFIRSWQDARQIIAWLPSIAFRLVAKVAFVIADRVSIPDTIDPPWWFNPAWRTYLWTMDRHQDIEEWIDKRNAPAMPD